MIRLIILLALSLQMYTTASEVKKSQNIEQVFIQSLENLSKGFKKKESKLKSMSGVYAISETEKSAYLMIKNVKEEDLEKLVRLYFGAPTVIIKKFRHKEFYSKDLDVQLILLERNTQSHLEMHIALKKGKP